MGARDYAASEQQFGENNCALPSMLQERGIYRTKDELEDLLRDDDEFFSYLQDLKDESKRTLGMLERLYHGEEDSCHKAGDDSSTTRRNGANRKSVQHNPVIEDVSAEMGRVDFHNNGEDSSNDESSNDDDEVHVPKLDAENQLNILPDDAIPFRGRPSSYEIINDMWSDYSWQKHYERVITPPRPRQINTWTPTTTIPKPFKMAQREVIIKKRNEKRREKLLEELEQRRQEEEEELQKKFKANPLPATTTLPLYDEIQAKNEQRRQHVKFLSKEILRATEQPFSFVKREEMKREMQRSMSFPESESAASKDGSHFKAKPFPEKIFNLSLADRQAEQEEYRKIRMQMRSEQLLSKSSLPPGMANRIASHSQKRDKKKSKHKQLFKPEINQDIPDFEELQRRFEDQLKARRTANALTVCEPFDLRTAKIQQRRSLKQSSELVNVGHQPPVSSVKASPQVNSPKKPSLPYPYSLTDAARLRENAIRQKIEENRQHQYTQQTKELNRGRKNKKLHQQVVRKSLVNDLSRSLGDLSSEKAKQFRKAEKNRQKEYQNYLKELEERVSHRPLLFEQETQVNAKRKAEQKYDDVLRQSGIGHAMLHKLATRKTDDGEESSVEDHNASELSVIESRTDTDEDDGQNPVYVESSPLDSDNEGHDSVRSDNYIEEGSDSSDKADAQYDTS